MTYKWTQVYKVYLIKVEQEEPFRLNLEDVFSLDHATRELRKEHVTRLTEETDPTNITLRIRCIYLISCLHDVSNIDCIHESQCPFAINT